MFDLIKQNFPTDVDKFQDEVVGYMVVFKVNKFSFSFLTGYQIRSYRHHLPNNTTTTTTIIATTRTSCLG